jgi:hypothetical protein
MKKCTIIVSLYNDLKITAMNMYPIVLILLIIVIVITDYFFFHKLKKKTNKLILYILHFSPGLIFIIFFLYIRFGLENQHDYRISTGIIWLIFAFVVIYVPKILYSFFHFFNFSLKKVLARKTNLLRYVGLIVSFFTLLLILYGGLIAPRDFTLKKIVIEVPDLPASFDGFRIVQFSDFHLGNWNRNFSIMEPITQIINSQQADILVFTGDMVNNFANETQGWQPYFLKLKSKSGKYAILGNHDYGDYANWKNESQRDSNLARIKQAIRAFGFRLLLNEHIYLTRGKDKIALIGVENWSKAPLSTYGDLKKAMVGVEIPELKILLTHDPSHWDAEVVGKQNIVLTLSGHTHAAQFGFYFNKVQLSPSSWVFEEWDGLYKKGKQYLYVNRGIGFVGIPMRIGVPPEITLIELRVKNK